MEVTGADTAVDADTDTALQDALVQMSFAVIAVVSAVAAAHDVSLTQLRLLAILRDHTPTMSELARHLGLDRSTVTGLVDRASIRGLVQRNHNNTDKRSFRVALTDAGQAMAANAAEQVATQLSPLIHRLTVMERVRFSRLLETLIGGSPSPVLDSRVADAAL